MKKLLLIGSIFLSVAALTAFTQLERNPAGTQDLAGCQHGQCVKIKADGNRCRSCAQQFSSYCWNHRL